MSRYFFHLHDREGTLLDREGKDFRDMFAARSYAVLMARSVMSADVESGIFDQNGFMEVVDEKGKTTLTVQFAEAVLRVV